MDIEAIKQIVNTDLPEEIKHRMIISVLSEDKMIIPIILDILNDERNKNEELVKELNVNLSRSHIYIGMTMEDKKASKNRFNKKFVMEEIEKFYKKYKGMISHCFNKFN